MDFIKKINDFIFGDYVIGIDPLTIGALLLSAGSGIAGAIGKSKQKKEKDQQTEEMLARFNNIQFNPDDFQATTGAFKERQAQDLQGLSNRIGLQGIGRSAIGNEIFRRTQRSQTKDFGRLLEGLRRQNTQDAFQRFQTEAAIRGRNG